MSTWYQKHFPQIKNIKLFLEAHEDKIKKIEGIESLYLWGSCAKNYNSPSFRVKDIDILAKTVFHSGDLISITDDTLIKNASNESLENQGYFPLAIKFSKTFINFSKYNIDHWAISSDNKLLHWGPIFIKKSEADDFKLEAENYASKKTGYNLKTLNKTSNNIRKNWYNFYQNYVNNYFKDMPSGWYQSNERVKNILEGTIEL